MAAPKEVGGGSFKRNITRTKTHIPGTKPSIINSQLLVSTGIPSFDNILGGGVALGSVLLIEEDAGGTYSRLMLQMYLAEGVTCKHALFLASGDVSPQELLKGLPEPITHDLPGSSMSSQTSSSEHIKIKESEDDLTIAWRYKNLNFNSSQLVSQFGHYYDLSKQMNTDLLNSIDKDVFEPSSAITSVKNCPQSCPLSSSYASLLESISKKVSDGNFSTNCQPAERNLLRIGIHSLGSPQWEDCTNTTNGQLRDVDSSIFRFLYALRSIVRSAYAVALVTIPNYLLQNSRFVSRVESLCDAAVRIESFCGTALEQDPTFKNYSGLFHVVKLPRLNCLVPNNYDTHDLAFKLRRKQFTIEKIHLPPAISDQTSSTEVHEKNKQLFGGKGDAAVLSCSSSSQNRFDF